MTWSTIRDSQKRTLYAWEQKVRSLYPQHEEKMTLEECQLLVNQVWRSYNQGQIPLVRHRPRTRIATGGRFDINLPNWARVKVVVLHELAHSLMSLSTYQGGKKEPSHGPSFARLLVELWEGVLGIPAAESLRIAREMTTKRKVKFALAAADIPRPASWQMQQWKKKEKELRALLDEHLKNKPKY